MGSSSWNSSDWQSFSAKTTAKPASQIFTQRGLRSTLNPLGVAVRESRDSDVNPNSHAIIVAADVTGSMGRLADALVRRGMGVMVEELLARKPVSDPHIMCMGVGDAYSDDAPLQVTQFEADIRIAEQLSQIWLEGNGGGNGGESYPLAWYFAARHTAIDCFEKRQKKGYLFTVGDENPHRVLQRSQVKAIFGDDISHDLDTAELLAMANRSYHVFHLMVEESHTFDSEVKKTWRDLLGERALLLSDHTKMAELIVSTIQVNEGVSVNDAVKSWSGDTSVVVAHGLNGLTPAGAKRTGMVRF